MSIKKNDLTEIEDQVLIFLYKDILLKRELDLKDIKAPFKVSSKEFKQRKENLGLKLLPKDKSIDVVQEMKKINYLPGKNSGNIFIFSTGKKSQILFMFKHLRNSVAHARIKKTQIGKDEYLLFEDYISSLVSN